MGCSPSKGQLFSKKTSQENEKKADQICDGEQVQIKAEINIISEGLPATDIEENAKNMQGKRPSEDDVVCDATVTVKEDETDQMLDVVHSHDGQSTQVCILEKQNEEVEEIQTKEKQGKRRKQRKQRLRKSSYVQSKAEFILKAHQAACAYLSPSTSKYESLLGLLSQAAQSHRSVETTVASVVLHYEEINQALEEMAAEGEQLLREHGHNMIWPSSLKDYPPTATKPSNETNVSQFPSELLQETLLQSTVAMISVGDSVKGLSDSALQELADYFGSVSQLLGEKLLAKHTAEDRLKQVLCHVEAAALRKPNPEDSALHSEDSGIGADNDSHNGPERLRRNRGSSGSGAITSGFTMTCSPDQQHLNGNEDATDNDDDDNDDDDDEDAEPEDEVNGKADSSRHLQHQDQVKTTNLKRKIRRPKTADNTSQVKLKHCPMRGPKRSQSAGCLFSTVEQSDPNEQQENVRNKRTPKWRRKNLFPDLSHGGRVRTKTRMASSGGQCTARNYGLQYGSKGPFRAMPPGSPPTYRPEPPGRNAVKRLIGTFSQGAEDNSRQSPTDQRPTGVRGNKKCSLPLLQNRRGTLTTDGNTVPHLDIDSLPPPPPEMLLDNPFESSAGLTAEEGAHNSHRHHTSAPRQANMQRGSISFSTRQEALLGSSIEEELKQSDVDSHRESHAHVGLRGSMPHQRCENDNEGEPAAIHSKAFPPTTPPVSRTRLPPSCPTVHHAVPTPPSAACQPSGRWTPTTKSTSSSLHRSVPVSGSRSYSEARAVFCQENQTQSQTWTPSCTSTLPRPWGEPARGRLGAARLQTSFMGRGPSGQRSQSDAKQQQGSDDTALTSEGTLRPGDTHSAPHTHSASVGEQITDELD